MSFAVSVCLSLQATSGAGLEQHVANEVFTDGIVVFTRGWGERKKICTQGWEGEK